MAKRDDWNTGSFEREPEHAGLQRHRAARNVLTPATVELIAVMLLLLTLALVTLPTWPYSTKWTYYPAGSCALAVGVIVFLTLGGRL
jgi:hypothetical protein